MRTSKEFQSVILFETVQITQWNITIWTIKSCVASFFFSLDCMTTDKTAFLDIILGDKIDEITSSEAKCTMVDGLPFICGYFDLYSSMSFRASCRIDPNHQSVSPMLILSQNIFCRFPFD